MAKAEDLAACLRSYAKAYPDEYLAGISHLSLSQIADEVVLLGKLEGKVKRLQAIVGKLLVNGDGDVIVPGDRHWAQHPENGTWVPVDICSIGTTDDSVEVEQLREDGDEIWGIDGENLRSNRPGAQAVEAEEGE